MKPTFWIIGALLVIIAVMLAFWPEPEDLSGSAEREKQFKTEIAILKVEKAEISSKFDSVVQTSKDKTKSDSLKIARKDSKIQGLGKLAKEKREKVEPVIQDNPDLLSFVETQQEIIQEQKEQIDTLKASVAFHQKVNDELVKLHDAEERIDQQLHEKKDHRIAELETQVKKERRHSRVARVLVPVAVGLGFLVGASLP